MELFYRDDIINLNQYDFSSEQDYFSAILNLRRQGLDKNRFFLKYIPEEELKKYDFSNKESLKNFRNKCLNLKLMGGCNLDTDYLERGVAKLGIQISDPTGKILGLFHMFDKKLTYSPIFGYFYEQRDLIKFAKDTYFTAIPFQKIVLQQLDLADEFYVHTDNYHEIKDIVKYGKFVLERISKDEMLDFINKPSKGEDVYKKYLKF